MRIDLTVIITYFMFGTEACACLDKVGVASLRRDKHTPPKNKKAKTKIQSRAMRGRTLIRLMRRSH